MILLETGPYNSAFGDCQASENLLSRGIIIQVISWRFLFVHSAIEISL